MLAILQRHQVPLTLFLLMLAGAFARLYGLAPWDYYHDEMWHVYVARQPTLREVLLTNFVEDGHPILPYLIWHYLLAVWNDPWMARLPSLVAGVLTIPAGYLWGREFFDTKNGGLFAAFFMAFSCLMIEQSDVVRGYALMMLFAVLMLWVACRYAKTANLRYLALYFIMALLATLSEFAVAPLLAYGALYLLHAIWRQEGGRLVVFLLWGIIHAALLFTMVWFLYLLKVVGGVDFSQSHFFIARHTQPVLLSAAKTVIYFLDYMNQASFAWLIFMAMQSVLLLIAYFLALWLFTVLGFVQLAHGRHFWPLLLVGIVWGSVIAFFCLDMVPLAAPRRNMAATFGFLVLLFYGLCYAAPVFKKWHPIFARPHKLICLATMVLVVGYIGWGRDWRVWIVKEFQQTRAQTTEIFVFMKAQAHPPDIILTDASSYYHFWNAYGPCEDKGRGERVARHLCGPYNFYVINNDLRMKFFIMNPAEMQRAFQEIAARENLGGKRIWIVGLQHTNAKTTALDPHYGFLFRDAIGGLAERYPDEVTAIIREQETLARGLYAAAVLKKVYRATPCEAEGDTVTIGGEDNCLISGVLLAFDRKTIDKWFLQAKPYADPEAFVIEAKKNL